MSVNMVTLLGHQSGAKRPKGYSEVLMWFRDGAFRGGHW